MVAYSIFATPVTIVGLETNRGAAVEEHWRTDQGDGVVVDEAASIASACTQWAARTRARGRFSPGSNVPYHHLRASVRAPCYVALVRAIIAHDRHKQHVHQ